MNVDDSHTENGTYWMESGRSCVDNILGRHAGATITEKLLRQILLEAFLTGARVYESRIDRLIREKDNAIWNLNWELQQKRKATQ